MLEQIDLKTGDMLYIIGDSIDRGGGLKVIQRIKELSDRGLATLLMGNHEYIFAHNLQSHLDDRSLGEYVDLAYDYEKKQKSLSRVIQGNTNQGTLSGVFMGFSNLIKKTDYVTKLQSLTAIIENSIKNSEICSSLEEWETYKDMIELPKEELVSLFDFINKNKKNITKEVIVNNNHFLLVHGGLVEEEYKCLFAREEFYTKPVDKELLQKLGYNTECKIIFGHTTTRDINIRLNHKYIAPNKIWYDEKNGDKIAIDCAASYPNGQLACLRLDDMKEFYVKNDDKYITPIHKINWCFDAMREKMKCDGTNNE